MKLLAVAAAVLLSLVAAEPAPPPAAADVAAAPVASAANAEGQEVPLPEYLTSETFEAAIASRLSLVEFFSPYCHHCTAFAPTWEATYREFREEMERLGIQMRQVDCVSQGDLCVQQDINGYPSIRLYGPDPETKQGRNFGQFPRTIEKTSENIKTFMRDSYAEFNDGALTISSASRKLSNEELANIIAGEPAFPKADDDNTPPDSWLVSFWPASEAQWEGKDGHPEFGQKCMDCNDYKVMWDRVSGQIQSYYKTAHVMCDDHKELCDSLDLKFEGRYENPEIVVFLPKQVGKVRWDYKGHLGSKSLKDWAMRLWESSRYEKITYGGLPDVMRHEFELPPGPVPYSPPLKNQVSVIYYFDGDKQSPEDETIMSYALEAVMKSPFNVYLYKSKHIKLETAMVQQSDALPKFINAIPGQDRKYKYDRALHVASTFTSKPTFLIFKDDSLMFDVFPAFAPEDVRDPVKVGQWIQQHQFPLHDELTNDNRRTYFNRSDDTNSKVVLTVVDLNDHDHMSKALYNMSAAAHEYHLNRQQYWFGEVESQRAKKHDKVDKLIDQGADHGAVVKAMMEEVPHYFDRDEAVFAYVDVNKLDNLSKKLKFDLTNYKVGDTLVVSRNQKQVWNTDGDGNALSSDPLRVRDVLLSLLDPSLVSPEVSAKVKVSSVASRGSSNSPYVAFAAFGVVAVAVYGYLRVRRGRRRQTTGMGILGNFEKKD
ncbi:hypothetical protein DIURU_001879 [Diutina rugosa]|uniref:Thioredoxin domain-containing protein n=1 Tax=Diutina rugosa TaxID=5481 RepID=A0A642UUI8_DIURU|nr:uncharacterized protein DIURU_001879 [Diutina rugosa]KAA8904603.1 hypothetical protein DIURU_001879 [Diutina rugosa]